MPDRTPLQPLSAEESAKIRATIGPRGVDEEGFPIGLTAAERKAAEYPGLPAPPKKEFHVKPGFLTSEFWLKFMAGAGVLFLGYTSTQGLDQIAKDLPSMGIVGSLLVLLVPLVKMGLGWLATKLAEKYGAQRTELKLAAMESAPAEPPKG